MEDGEGDALASSQQPAASSQQPAASSQQPAGLPIDLDLVVASPDWSQAMRAVDAVARRRVPLRFREDVVADTRAEVLAAVAAGRAIRNLASYAGAVAVSVVRKTLAARCPEGCSVDLVEATPPRLSFDELLARPGLPPGFLRGAAQKRAVEWICAGRDLDGLARSLGVEVWELRRQVDRLASMIAVRRSGEDS